MTDRPIIFSAPMVRALLDGRKTQTRRALRVPAPFDPSDEISAQIATGFIEPQFRRSDRLWVREAHYMTDDGESSFAVFAEDEARVAEHLRDMQTIIACHPHIDWSKHLRLRPSIHMPRWASRITLTVTDVRVQRLQDISEADAVAEGATSRQGAWPSPDWSMDWSEIGKRSRATGKPLTQACIALGAPRWAFASYWNDLHGPDAWAANPWVVALTFTVQRGNIDQVAACAS